MHHATVSIRPGRDDRQLLTSVLDGDRVAAVTFVGRVAPVIRARAARGLARSGSRPRGPSRPADIDDLTQEVYLRLFKRGGRALKAWDPDLGLSLVNFVGLLAEREVTNVLASRRRSPVSSHGSLADVAAEPPADAAPHAVPETRVLVRDVLVKVVRRLYAWLTPRGRQLFELVFVQQRSVAEVATRLGLRRGAVYTWKSRVKARAREIAQDLQG